MLAMDENIEPQSKVSVRDPMETKTDHVERSKRCSGAGTLRRRVQGHNEEKTNKCNQCDYASAHACHLRTHLKIHSGEKSNKCNQCDYATNHVGNFKIHVKKNTVERS